MKNDKKDLILEAAQELMFQMTDKDISVNLIAKKAGIAKGSVYYYFKSKDEILDAVVEKCYKNAIHEFFRELDSEKSALQKINLLFDSIIKSEFSNKEKNLIVNLHLSDDVVLHNKMKMIAVQEISPILTALLKQGCIEGSIQTEYPKESAEMIVAVLTFFLDDTFFPSGSISLDYKLKFFSYCLEMCLKAEPGSFGFLHKPIETD
ncbi:MAG: TetR/AcrR family transcriptional regulator [Ruminococcus flavefaciens]|nr:TetR/AcrR family transcriptional regulator [Ruminococcus flavefaciens]MCM1230977.1 TetR/AcrR family transcriptional regulator [Ruminococcus flavefaciens]